MAEDVHDFATYDDAAFTARYLYLKERLFMRKVSQISRILYGYMRAQPQIAWSWSNWVSSRYSGGRVQLHAQVLLHKDGSPPGRVFRYEQSSVRLVLVQDGPGGLQIH